MSLLLNSGRNKDESNDGNVVSSDSVDEVGVRLLLIGGGEESISFDDENRGAGVAKR